MFSLGAPVYKKHFTVTMISWSIIQVRCIFRTELISLAGRNFFPLVLMLAYVISNTCSVKEEVTVEFVSSCTMGTWEHLDQDAQTRVITRLDYFSVSRGNDNSSKLESSSI